MQVELDRIKRIIEESIDSPLTFPFRRSHIAKVYRGERPQKGRYREFYQCDIDVIGERELSVAYDAEIPRVIYSIFSQLDFSSSVEVMRVIDKVDKISRTEFIAELKKLGMNTDQIDLLNQYVFAEGDPDSIWLHFVPPKLIA